MKWGENMFFLGFLVGGITGITLLLLLIGGDADDE